MIRKKVSSKKSKSEHELRDMVYFAGECCLEKKAEDVVVLDLFKVTDVTDYFLIAGGYTDIHVRAVADHVIESLRKHFAISPWHVEGMENGRWVLVDYVDFVVHVFQPETRDFYQLERLWTDAGRHGIEDPQTAGKSS